MVITSLQAGTAAGLEFRKLIWCWETNTGSLACDVGNIIGARKYLMTMDLKKQWQCSEILEFESIYMNIPMKSTYLYDQRSVHMLMPI